MQEAEQPSNSSTDRLRKSRELRLLVFILVVLFPVMTIMLVGGIGLGVWIWQTFTTPPFSG